MIEHFKDKISIVAGYGVMPFRVKVIEFLAPTKEYEMEEFYKYFDLYLAERGLVLSGGKEIELEKNVKQ
jgi:hypothetical protein